MWKSRKWREFFCKKICVLKVYAVAKGTTNPVEGIEEGALSPSV